MKQARTRENAPSHNLAVLCAVCCVIDVAGDGTLHNVTLCLNLNPPPPSSPSPFSVSSGRKRGNKKAISSSASSSKKDGRGDGGAVQEAQRKPLNERGSGRAARPTILSIFISAVC